MSLASIFTRELIDNMVDCCHQILDHRDARIPTQMLDAQMYSCCAIGVDGLRPDGKPGNVLYSDEKAK